MELAALEHLKNWCLHVFSVAIDLILFKLASYKDMHKILDDFGQIQTLIAELVVLECLKNTRVLISGTFRRLTLEVLSPEKKTIALLFENYSNF